MNLGEKGMISIILYTRALSRTPALHPDPNLKGNYSSHLFAHD